MGSPAQFVLAGVLADKSQMATTHTILAGQTGQGYTISSLQGC